MTLYEAQDQVSAAIKSLTAVRDALGQKLSKPGLDLQDPDNETRRLSDLHDRVARAIQAYK
ncbi:hypothetical protein [Actibacterium pelagium]|uniref:Uncharacterized protein n=1 Tax=Actibacterium pelagium TaxID=2029103 RepID=A0A917ANQ5_9RHOB|nr:hypothetical protein [Actibacterium pelagium]GGE62396.1 hypothetical protein GCM10011517_32610 [Actibacterium pelagium]